MRFIRVNNTFFLTKSCLNVCTLYSFQCISQLINYYRTLHNNEKPDTFVYLMGMWYAEKNTIYNGEKCSLSNKLCWETGQPRAERTKITKKSTPNVLKT